MAAPPRTLVFRSFAFAVHEPGLVAGWTERWGGVSEPPYDDLNLALHVGDGQTAVLENRRRVAAALGIELEAVRLRRAGARRGGARRDGGGPRPGCFGA